MKVCGKCKLRRPPEDFYPDRSKKDGRHTICRGCVKAARRVHYNANRARIRREQNTYSRSIAPRRRQQNRELRYHVLSEYGGKCECCGETEFDFLSIDHANGDGAEHRRQFNSGSSIYFWLRREGFPKDGRFRVLCFNCNLARGFYGSCPHERVEEAVA